MTDAKNILLSRLPVITLKEVVVFPEMVVTLFIRREKSLNAIQQAIKSSNNILTVAQKDYSVDNPRADQLYDIGTLSEIIQIVTLPDETVKLVIKGLKKVALKDIILEEELFNAEYKILEDSKSYPETSLDVVREGLLESFALYVEASKKINQQLFLSIKKIDKLNPLLDAIVSNLPIRTEDKQAILEINDIIERVAYLNSILEVELDIVNVEKKIRDRVKQQMEKNQKDYYLNEQIKAIQKELNNGEELKDEVKELTNKSKKIKLSSEAKEKVATEIKKLSMMNQISAEATVVRGYIETLIGVPWKVFSSNTISLEKAEEYLEEEHYSLSKVKERILDYLAVLKKSKLLKAPILCLVGPPGVGKTSLAKSIAKASGREFIRISLGGVRDEAEIRGHRRTYIGAMPGKIIQAMKKAKVSNPMILLDEIDKMGSDFRGDPASALLEVLDPEQNSNFVDHYLEVGYDLSNVMFITTANSLNIQEALLDRMEVIELTGYSEEEKLEIVRRHLLPKKMKEAALNNKEFQIEDGAIIDLIRLYTKESGVRELERMVATVARKVAKKIVQKETKSVVVTKKNLTTFAGVAKYKDNQKEKNNQVGVTTGMAWTRVGGEILQIEALRLPGKGDIKITGKLGEVMQESIKAAYSLLYSKSSEIGIKEEDFKNYDIHIHVPEGAIPKDGPSAGVGMVTSIYSVLSGNKVRNDVAMTGEITLRGKVLPIGGVREKLLAALRAGITNIIIPEDNMKDLLDLPKKALQELKITGVSNIMEVLDNAIEKNIKKKGKNKENNLTI